MITKEELIVVIAEALPLIEDPTDEYYDIDGDKVAFAVYMLKKALERAK